jgi:hypothetical protein
MANRNPFTVPTVNDLREPTLGETATRLPPSQTLKEANSVTDLAAMNAPLTTLGEINAGAHAIRPRQVGGAPKAPSAPRARMPKAASAPKPKMPKYPKAPR